MSENTTKTVNSLVEPYYEYAKQAVDEQAILDKYNAATIAQFNAQREANRNAENAFYNQMYNTQKTAMDTIRQSNAAAVSSGASRGVQAAQELSSLLGLQQESVASATELAQANRQTAQEETAAMLENVLNAYTQAQQERDSLVQSGIQAASVEQEREAAAAASQNATAQLVTQATENGTNTYLSALIQSGIDYSDGVITPESQASFDIAVANIHDKNNKPLQFVGDDWAGSATGSSKATVAADTIKTICDAYGLNYSAYTKDLNEFKELANNSVAWDSIYTIKFDSDEKAAGLSNTTTLGKAKYAAVVQSYYDYILTKIRNDYASGANRKQKSE